MIKLIKSIKADTASQTSTIQDSLDAAIEELRNELLENLEIISQKKSSENIVKEEEEEHFSSEDESDIETQNQDNDEEAVSEDEPNEPEVEVASDPAAGDAGGAVRRPATSNIARRPAASNIVRRPAASNVVRGNAVGRPAASNVVRGNAAERPERFSSANSSAAARISSSVREPSNNPCSTSEMRFFLSPSIMIMPTAVKRGFRLVILRGYL